MTYVLVLVACLSAEPGRPPGSCHVERLPLPGIGNATACHLAARLRLGEWLREGNDIRRLADARCEEAPAPQSAALGSPVP
jgi:hypothetical protein